jgi:hypothetical protein
MQVIDAEVGEQILDLTKAKREPEIEPDRLVNDLRREPRSGIAVILFGYQAADAVTTSERRRADIAQTWPDV